jgi:hypothetical protein
MRYSEFARKISANVNNRFNFENTFHYIVIPQLTITLHLNDYKCFKSSNSSIFVQT